LRKKNKCLLQEKFFTPSLRKSRRQNCAKMNFYGDVKISAQRRRQIHKAPSKGACFKVFEQDLGAKIWLDGYGNVYFYAVAAIVLEKPLRWAKNTPFNRVTQHIGKINYKL